MTRTKRLLYIASGLFIAAEIVFGILLQITYGVATVVFSYLSVVLACLFCALFCEYSAIYLTTQAALLCTVCADWFLVVTAPRQQLPAMLFFSAAQLLYAARLLYTQSHVARRVHLTVRAILSLLSVILVLLVLGKSCDAVAIVSLFYYVNLLLNILYAFLAGRRERVFAIGLVLFLLCDTVIGLSCLDAYIAIHADSMLWRIIHPGFNLAWIFYVPSQALISLSLLPRSLEKPR